MKPTNAQQKKQKMRPEKKKQKVKVKITVSWEILLSAHARTLQADILHLDQKATKCMSCKRLCDKF